MDLEGNEASGDHAAHSTSSTDMFAVDDADLFYPVYDDFESDSRKQGAADTLSHFSRFAMVCISKGVQPSQLRLHLMKEVSGIPTSLHGQQFFSRDKTAQDVASSSSASALVPADEMHVMHAEDKMESS